MDVVNVGVVVTLRISEFGWFVGGVGFGLWGFGVLVLLEYFAVGFMVEFGGFGVF